MFKPTVASDTNFPKPITESNTVPKYLTTFKASSDSPVTYTRNEPKTIASSAFLRNESETKFKVESEIPNIPPPRYNASKNSASQAWKNLRLKVITAKAFNNELANRNIRRYGYDPRQFQLS